MRAYNDYTESGIAWLGKIPGHWTIKRLKEIIRKNITDGPHETPEFVNEGIPFISIDGIQDGELTFKNCRLISKENFKKYSKKVKIEENDIFIGKAASTGKIARVKVDFDFTIWSPIAVVKLHKKYSPIYIEYVLKSEISQYQIVILSTHNTQSNIAMKDIPLIKVIIPPTAEQTAIAHYLDTKTQVIDQQISLLKKKLGCYKALRESIINNAVTKGLANHVPWKDSGITWMGAIPKHWGKYRLKNIGYLYSGLSGKSGEDFRQEENDHNKGFIPFTNIMSNTYIADDNIGTVVVEPTERQNKVQKGDIFFLMSSEVYEDIGKSSVLDKDLEDTYLNSFCKGYRLKSNRHNPYFINYLLLSSNYRDLLIVEGRGFTRINLKMEKVNSFFVHLPPTKEEQKAIAQYLDSKTDTIDSLVSHTEAQIVKLQELRKTLIHDVVTGKIKVLA